MTEVKLEELTKDILLNLQDGEDIKVIFKKGYAIYTKENKDFFIKKQDSVMDIKELRVLTLILEEYETSK